MAQAALLALTLMLTPLSARADEARSHKVEAAFLYNFFNYITWPGFAAPADLHEASICIAQDDAIAPYLAYVQQKMSAERAITVRELAEADTMEGCNLLFMRHRLGSAEWKNLPPTTLVVIEPMDSLDRGDGMIELNWVGKSIQMKIDQARLEEKGYKVSSRLLNLAVQP